MTVLAHIGQLLKLWWQMGNVEVRARCPHCGYDAAMGQVNQRLAETDASIRVQARENVTSDKA